MQAKKKYLQILLYIFLWIPLQFSAANYSIIIFGWIFGFELEFHFRTFYHKIVCKFSTKYGCKFFFNFSANFNANLKENFRKKIFKIKLLIENFCCQFWQKMLQEISHLLQILLYNCKFCWQYFAENLCWKFSVNCSQ